ncbi:MAG: glycosyltransferase family 2 protein [Oxalobacteraceae bacterium]|nr:glycosyltransferase family 2 protein [Oxalobacteraceae bacterium]
MKKIAVLISCFNRKNKTIKCLEKLYFQNISDLYDLNTFLVDDGSTDGTSEAVAKLFPRVRIINGDGNLYWNRGMSLAWSSAGYHGHDYYLWLNDDVELFDGALLKLLESYETASVKKPFVLIGSTCDPVSGQVTYGGAKRSDIRFKKLRFNLINPGAELIAADTLNGNIVLVPEYISSNLMGLDPQFSHAMGDTDFGLRATKAGFSMQVAPSYYGTCAHNSVESSYLDEALSKKIRFKKMLSPKGLPLRDWAIFCQRHAGKLWVAYFLWPYLKFLIRR